MDNMFQIIIDVETIFIGFGEQDFQRRGLLAKSALFTLEDKR